MQANQLRRANQPSISPPTPNLQEFKQKYKSKSRRKPNSIQPSNPPTPKILKAQINLKINTQNNASRPHHTQQLPPRAHHTCINHHNLTATRYQDTPNGRVHFCDKCYFMSLQDCNDDQVRIEKRKELDQFKGKIKGFGLKLQEANEQLKRLQFQNQQNFYKQRDYITDSFCNLRAALEQKQRELMNNLLFNMENFSKILRNNNKSLEDIKESVERYMNDIERHYNSIIQDLPFQEFSEIIQKYHCKINYHQQTLEQLISQKSINVYIPRMELEKSIDKAQVRTFPPQENDTSGHHRSMQRYPTQKQQNLKQSPYYSAHHDSANTKLGIRHSREYNDFNSLKCNFNKENMNLNWENKYC